MDSIKKTFGKKEKLTSEKVIGELFAKKDCQSEFSYPLIMIFKAAEIPCSQVFMSVGKKKFKRAVDRNLLRRRIKEAYRLHKIPTETKYQMAFLYIAKEELPYGEIEAAMKKLLLKLT